MWGMNGIDNAKGLFPNLARLELPGRNATCETARPSEEDGNYRRG